MQNFYFTLVAFLFFAIDCFSQGVWTQKTDYAGGNTNYAVGFSIGTKGYIGTGRDSTFATTNSFWEYDPAGDSWMQRADFGGVARGGAVGFSIGSKGYIGTGVTSSSVFLNDFWEYDPGLNSWTPRANFAGTPRHYATGFSIGSKGYIGTGDTTASSDYVKDFWEYDPIGDTWTPIALFPGLGRGPAVGFSIGTKGYFGTGNDEISDLPSRDFWEYDPASNSWTQKANIPMGKCAATGFSLGGKGYIGTGVDSIPPMFLMSIDFWEYDPLFNTWTQKTDFGGTARKHAVAFAIGTKGYLGTGYGTKDFWEFDPNGVGINELKEEISVSVYPNPMIESSTIQTTFSSNKKTLLQFELYDLTGKKVRSVVLENSDYKLNRNQLSSGTYIYNVLSENKMISKGKLIIQ